VAEAMPRKWSLLGVCACAFFLLVFAAGHGTERAAATKHCAPVVTKSPGGGFDTATVLVEAGRVDCEKARKVLFSAISKSSYKNRQIQGWTCSSTSRASSSQPYGAKCNRELPGEPRDVVASTQPRPCSDCHSIRD
jgi:hypothetical protein